MAGGPGRQNAGGRGVNHVNHRTVPSHFRGSSWLAAFGLLAWSLVAAAAPTGDGDATKPFLQSELIFPLETWHNHASCIVETPKGDLLVCWFHGSGERTADDVKIEGARLRHGSRSWSPRFTLADTTALPDGNPCLLIDPRGRLWLFYTTILANTWESALQKYRIASDYHRDGPPRWEFSDVLHVKPGPEFSAGIRQALPQMETAIAGLHLSAMTRKEAQDYLVAMRQHAGDKLYNRLGWMTRAHPVLLDGRRLIVPLYHDG